MSKDRNLTINDIKKIIASPEIKLVSFDIFDTLLVRPSMLPTDIFYLLDKVDINGQKIDFVKLRIKAEPDLNNPHANFADIWNGIRKNNPQLSYETIEILKNKELELEERLLTVRKDVLEIYEYAVALGKRIIAISDMYLSSDVLKNILSKKGYAKIENVYVSCEHHCRKDEGKLFDVVLKKENIHDVSKIVHIGDNFYSDCKIPIEKGITALYYPSIWEIVIGKDSWWKKAFGNEHISVDPFVRLLYSFTFLYSYNNGYSLRQDRCFENIADFAQMFLSPLVVSVVLDIINNDQIQNDYEQILFSARDGYLPLQIYKVFEQKLNIIPAYYLHLSRKALSYVKYKDFFEYYNSVSMLESYYLSSFVQTSILDESLKKKILSEISKEDNVDLLKEREKGEKFLEKYAAELNSYFIEQKNLARRFYKEFFEKLKGDRQVVFDCGYGGSVSTGLMAANTDIIIDKYYLWQNTDNVLLDKKNKTKTFCKFETPVPAGTNIIIEECFSPGEGSHIGFKKQQGEITPVLEKLEIGDSFKASLDIILSVTYEYATNFVTCFETYLTGFRFDSQDVFSKIGEYVFLKSQTSELDIFKCFNFPDAYVRENNSSLAYKVESTFEKLQYYSSAFSGTGFMNAENYLKPIHKNGAVNNIKYKIGIHLHLYNRYLLQEFVSYIKDFPYTFDLIITVTNQNIIPVINKICSRNMLNNLNEVLTIPVQNRGRDVAPWLVDTAKYQKKYDIFCHVHTKESTQYDHGQGAAWRKFLFDNLLEKEAVLDTVDLFMQDEKLGIIFPECFNMIKEIYDNSDTLTLLGNDGEEKIISSLLKQMGINENVLRHELLYSVGTMMWYRPEALKLLFDLGLKTEDFPQEPVGVGGTIAHAIERLPGLIAQKQGYKARFYTRYPQQEYNWATGGVKNYLIERERRSEIGLSGAIKVFINKRIPFLFKEVENRYDDQMGIRGALGEFLSKQIKKVFC